MKKQLLMAAFLLAMALTILTGCEKKEESYEESTISVDKKGRVSENIVESFGKEYYDVNELSLAFNAAIDAYNAASGENSAVLNSITSENGKVYASLNYTDCKAYEGVQNATLFSGTIGEAAEAGYNFDVMLKGTENGDKISRVQIMGMKDKHIIILSEPVKVITYEPIGYVSANVDVLGEKEARITSEYGAGLAYIVLKK